jgi:hypothetical protein
MTQTNIRPEKTGLALTFIWQLSRWTRSGSA